MDAGLAIVLLFLLAHYFYGKDILVKIAIVFLLLCMIVPGVFKPFARIWFGLSEYMATVMSRLLLTFVFTFLIIPVGCVRKLLGKDPLKLYSWRSGSDSLFSVRNHRYTPSDLEQPY